NALAAPKPGTDLTSRESSLNAWDNKNLPSGIAPGGVSLGKIGTCQSAESCTFTAYRYVGTETKENYEFPATVLSLPGKKWYGGHGPLIANSQFFNCLAALLYRF